MKSFTKADIDRKTVEFQIRLRSGVLKRIAEFWVRENPGGELSIDIMTTVPGNRRGERIQNIYNLPLAYVERIATHPDPSVADFRLVILGCME